MALFFEYPTGVNPTSGKGPVVTMSFSPSDHPIMAVATKNGDVSMYLEEGESLDPEAVIHRQGECTAMAWHPKHAICAQGWDDGTVALWTEKDRVLREETNTHKSPITFIAWSPEGSRLLTGDASGNLAVWAGDHRARLTLLSQYPLKKQASSGPVTHVVFRAPTNITGDAALLQSCPSFFFGGGNGIIYFADDLGHCSEVINVGTSLNFMYYSHAKDYLVLVTVDAVLYKYKISPEGKMTQDKKVKLSIKGGGGELQCAAVGSGLLAAANSEPVVRVWHLEKDDSYVLSLTDPRHMTNAKDTVTCLAFNPRKRVLAGGTSGGRVVMWRYVGRGDSEPSEQDWDVLPSVEIRQHIASVVWGPGEGLLAFSTKDSASILLETVLNNKSHAHNAVIQMSSEQLYIQMGEHGKGQKITTGIRIKGVDINDKYVLVWNGKRAEVRELKEGMSNAAVTSTFATRAVSAALHGDTIYTTVGSRIEICSLQGVVKQVITLTENEGTPLNVDVHGDFLVVATSSNIVKLWDISRREPKQLVPGRSFEENPGIIKSVKVNCLGSKISILCNRLDDAGVQIPDSKAYVYDVELDKLQSYEFGPKYYPVVHHWDVSESKLLAIETRRYESIAAAERRSERKEEKVRAGEEEYDDIKTESKLSEAEITTLFATSDYGILMQDSFGIDPTNESLMGIHVPFLLFMTRPTEHDMIPHIKRRSMRDFVGLEKVNDEVKNDLMQFSYHLTTGNMDEAYRAVKKISSTSIWENMAQMCVKTKRLDVAEVCLGNMDNARGARAIREAKKEPQHDAQVAMLAIQLNLLDDAERLYKECGRYDLLVQLYQASGRWKDALKICSQHDRIHLKTTHYLYARHLEAIGDTAGAIKNYEKSETHKHEVPRMLFDSQHIQELEHYIKTSEDSQLIKWWAQYCESNQQYEEAVKYYSAAKETLALVRVYCYLHQDEKAQSICLETNDAAACYHLARQYESQDKIAEAIQFYTRAKRFNHGIRLAKEHGLDNELMSLALESNKQLKIDAARYFESREQYDKAVLLYTKGGRITKALELCFKGQLFDTLRTISDDLGSDTDPALLIKCADFFIQHQQYDKAVHLMITAGEYEKGLNMCIKHGVKITDAMAEKMTPPKEKAKSNEEKNERSEILKKLAHTCKDQGSYHLACKKYTQAGDQIRAMKCLLKSSDTEKIIYYAAMTKKREIYVLAANYLQNLDWHNDPEIMKTIISFYTKAKAMQQLAVFYDACAQVEIDEYRDYEKALGALREALKYIIKCKPFPEKDAKMASLDSRIRLVERFVEARKLVKSNPDEMIRICNQLLEQQQIEAAIRVGDVFALLIEYYHSIANYPQAYHIIERMRGANIILSPYLDQAMVQTIHNAVGATMQQQHHDDHGIGEDIRQE